MLRRLTLGFFGLACAVAVAACSSSTGTAPLSSGGVPGIGPNLATNTVYAVDSTQNAIEIYAPNPTSSSKPIYEIGGSSTLLEGPQYAVFDPHKRLYVSNYDAATGAAQVTVYQTYAIGNVLPLSQITGAATQLTEPGGIAYLPATAGFVVANTDPKNTAAPDQLLLFGSSATGAASPAVISGSNTLLDVPTGVAVDANNNIYVADRGNGSVTVYALPSSIASPSPSPSASPSPSPSPSGSPSPSPSPTPIAGLNLAPIQDISGSNTGLAAPTGIAVDSTGNIYVVDPDQGSPSVRVFAAGATGNVAPVRTITGSATGLKYPTDVKVDSAGNIYVADSGAGAILIFGPNANGNVAPTATVAAPGSVVGLALSP
jgi:hypothetical protein